MNANNSYFAARKAGLPAIQAWNIAKLGLSEDATTEFIKAVRKYGTDSVMTVVRGLENAPFGAGRKDAVMQTLLGVEVAPGRRYAPGISASAQGRQIRALARIATVSHFLREGLTIEEIEAERSAEDWKEQLVRRAERNAAVREWNSVPGAGLKIENKPESVKLYGLRVPNLNLNGQQGYSAAVLIVADDMVSGEDAVCWLPERIMVDSDEPFEHNSNMWDSPLKAEHGRPRRIKRFERNDFWGAMEPSPWKYGEKLPEDKYYLVVYYPCEPDSGPFNTWSQIVESEFNAELGAFVGESINPPLGTL